MLVILTNKHYTHEMRFFLHNLNLEARIIYTRGLKHKARGGILGIFK